MGIQNKSSSTKNEDLWGWDEDDTITSGSGNDTLAGGKGDDTISGGAGSDWIRDYTWSWAGGWVVHDGPGTDEDDHAYAPTDGNGVDYHQGGNDEFHGGAGDDFLAGFSGSDWLYGGRDDDTMWGGTGNDVLDGGEGEDVLYGNSGHDILIDLAGDDVMKGGSGDDSLIGGKGNDTYDGGAGVDWLDFTYLGEGSTSRFGQMIPGATITLAEGSDGSATYTRTVYTPSGGFQETETDVVRGIENVVGSGLADRITGNSADNIIHGLNGNDRIEGRGGNDILEGQAGNDVITGGLGIDEMRGDEGSDTFVFLSSVDSSRSTSSFVATADLIHGFQDGPDGDQDVVDLSALDLADGFGDLSFRDVFDAAQGRTVTALGVNTDADAFVEMSIRFDRVITTFDAGDFLF